MAKEINGVKYSLVHEDLFDRTLSAKGMKTKDFSETVKAFLSMITVSNRPKKPWIDRGTEFAGAFINFCVAEGIQVYSTMNETKAAFAERTIRSLKNIFYRYMRDYGYIHKLPQFFTILNSRRNRSIDLRPNTVKKCDFMSILYSKPLREFKKPTFKIGDRMQISESDLPFHKGYKPQLTGEVFEIVATATKKNHQHTQSKMIKTRLFNSIFIKKS